MAYSIRELEPITEALLNGDVLFEGVTAEADTNHRYARKVKTGNIETFFAREESLLAAKSYVDAEVEAETTRAEGVETTLQTAISYEYERAEYEERRLDVAKADKITVQKTLSNAAVGDALHRVSFDQTHTPTPPFTSGNIILNNGERFELSSTGVFSFIDGAGVATEIYSPDTGWIIPYLDTGNTLVESETNAEGGIWDFCKWSFVEADLQTVKTIAEQARNYGAQALSTASSADDKADTLITENAVQDSRLDAIETKNDQQDTQLNALESKNTEQDGKATTAAGGQTGTFEEVDGSDPLVLKSYADEFIDTEELDAAIEAHNTDGGAHEDIRTAVDERLLIADVVNDLTTEESTKALSAEQGFVLKGLIDAIPAISQELNDIAGLADGEYKLVIAGGIASWEPI